MTKESRKTIARERVGALKCGQCNAETLAGSSTCSGCGASLRGAEQLSALDISGKSAGKFTGGSETLSTDRQHLDDFGE